MVGHVLAFRLRRSGVLAKLLHKLRHARAVATHSFRDSAIRDADDLVDVKLQPVAGMPQNSPVWVEADFNRAE